MSGRTVAEVKNYSYPTCFSGRSGLWFSREYFAGIGDWDETSGEGG